MTTTSSVLWTDIVTPAELTGYGREALADYERRQGSLARWLPNRMTPGIVARFIKGRTGLVEAARWRAYDAAPEVGRRKGPKRVTLELPAIGQELPISEYEQLIGAGATVDDELARLMIENVAAQVVQAVSDGVELMRGIALITGKSTINQDNFQSDDDFGRPPSHTIALTGGDLWSDTSVSRLDFLETIVDTYSDGAPANDSNPDADDAAGADPGVILMPRRVYRALARGDEFKTNLVGGGSRPPSKDEVNSTIEAAGLPPIEVYDRRVVADGVRRRVLPNDTLLLLPEPVEVDDAEGTDLGATIWGRTLTSADPSYEIAADEQPGIVVGAYKHPKPPMIREVISDAIGLPVLANAELSLAAKVL